VPNLTSRAILCKYEFYLYRNINHWQKAAISRRCGMGGKEVLDLTGKMMFSEGEEAAGAR
jgi:hypothetical protein